MDRQEAIERIKQNKAAAEFYAQLTSKPKSVDDELKDIEAFNMAIEALESELPKGKWRGEHKMPDMPRYEWYRCSECGFLSQSVVNYCPNCGARMREVSGGK